MTGWSDSALTLTRVVTLLVVSTSCGSRSEPIRAPLDTQLEGSPTAVPEPEAASRATLEVEVNSLRSSSGKVFVALFDSAEAFPDVDKAVRAAEVGVVERVARARFEGLAPGDYALLVLHDENGNGALDKNLIGIPSEGVGASNDAQGRFGPAKYDKARFELRPPGGQVRVGVVYFN